MKNIELKESYQACDAIMAEASKSFYAAFSLLPKDRFQAVTALYAFNRYVDDLVDKDIEDLTDAEIVHRLDDLKQAILDLQAGKNESAFSQLTWWPAFVDTLETYQIDTQALFAQIDGQLMDMEGFSVSQVSDLLLYSLRVAGAVGVMMLPILLKNINDQFKAGLRQAAISLGIGMQFTNILRDIGEDYRDRRRIYLPSDLMEDHGVSEALIADLSLSEAKDLVVPENFINLWEHLAQKADEFYEKIFAYVKEFHPKARLPLLSSALIYRGISDEVRKAGYNCFTQRNYTSKLDRIRYIQEAKSYLAKI